MFPSFRLRFCLSGAYERPAPESIAQKRGDRNLLRRE